MNTTVQIISDEEELEKKRREIESKTQFLAERELELATLRHDLARFERKYMNRVGRLYVELDELRAKIARRKAKANRKDKVAQEEAAARNEQAWHSREEYERSQRLPILDMPPEKFVDLRAVYRRLAKICHPDTVTDFQEKEYRTQLMSEINAAYEKEDLETLLKLEQELMSNPNFASREKAKTEFDRLDRQLAQIDKRLQEIAVEIDLIKGSSLWQLYSQAKDFEIRGIDMLAQLADRIQKQIDQEKMVLAQLAKN